MTYFYVAIITVGVWYLYQYFSKKRAIDIDSFLPKRRQKYKDIPEVDNKTIQEACKLIRRGKRKEAVKIIVETTGMPVVQAKEFVDKLSSVFSDPEETDLDIFSDKKSFDEEIKRLLASGNKIAAIKYVKEATAWSLKDAKEYVDKIEEKNIRIDDSNDRPPSGVIS